MFYALFPVFKVNYISVNVQVTFTNHQIDYLWVYDKIPFYKKGHTFVMSTKNTNKYNL